VKLATLRFTNKSPWI